MRSTSAHSIPNNAHVQHHADMHYIMETLYTHKGKTNITTVSQYKNETINASKHKEPAGYLQISLPSGRISVIDELRHGLRPRTTDNNNNTTSDPLITTPVRDTLVSDLNMDVRRTYTKTDGFDDKTAA